MTSRQTESLAPQHKVFARFAGAPEGRKVVLIHGAPGSLAEWEGVLEALSSDRSFQTASIDRPGYGNSERRVPCDFDEQIERIGAFCRDWAREDALILVGHSYGAPIAATITQDLVSRGRPIAGLVLAAGVLSPKHSHSRWFHSVLGCGLLRPIFPNRWRAAQEMMAIDPILPQLESFWSTVNVPTCLIHGDADGVIPVADSDFVFHKIPKPHCQFQRLERAGHALPRSHPQTIANALRWIDEHANVNKASE